MSWLSRASSSASLLRDPAARRSCASNAADAVAIQSPRSSSSAPRTRNSLSAHVELDGALPDAIRLGRGPLDLLAPVSNLLFGERQPPLAFDELLLGVLDQLAPRVEIGADLVEAARPRVDLRRAAGNGLIQQALAVAERLPRLLELVLLVRHAYE